MKTALKVGVLLAITTLCATAQDVTLDLPVGHPKDPPVIKGGPVEPEEEPEDDPNDEPAPVFFGEELQSASESVVFVLDVSGSMNQPAWDDELGYGGPLKITTAKREVCAAISAMSEEWRFAVVAYDDYIYMWRERLVAATEANKADAKAWVEARQPVGGTGTGPAVAIGLALDRQNALVVLLTDGAPNVPDPNPDWHRALIRDQNVQRAQIHVFGIEANTPAMRSFCQGVATDSDGRYVDAR